MGFIYRSAFILLAVAASSSHATAAGALAAAASGNGATSQWYNGMTMSMNVTAYTNAKHYSNVLGSLSYAGSELASRAMIKRELYVASIDTNFTSLCEPGWNLRFQTGLDDKCIIFEADHAYCNTVRGSLFENFFRCPQDASGNPTLDDFIKFRSTGANKGQCVNNAGDAGTLYEIQESSSGDIRWTETRELCVAEAGYPLYYRTGWQAVGFYPDQLEVQYSNLKIGAIPPSVFEPISTCMKCSQNTEKGDTAT